MQFISSDTNIWIDFSIIDCLDIPFRLSDTFTYLMASETIEHELQTPADLKHRLLGYGLVSVDLSEAEYQLILKYQDLYPKLSVYDLFALAISKVRGIILLSGDKALWCAAMAEGVEAHGTIWLVDLLLEYGRLTVSEYRSVLQRLKENCGNKIRLPKEELEKRLKI